jgi:hypothetical protein
LSTAGIPVDVVFRQGLDVLSLRTRGNAAAGAD